VRVSVPAPAPLANGGEGIVSEIGVEGLGRLEERVSELSEHEATHARLVLEEIERARREAREKGWVLVVRDAAEILEKMRGKNTAYIGSAMFNPASTPSPGTYNFSLSFFNPDVDNAYIWTYLCVCVGPGVLPADVGEALAVRDLRFPTLILPDYPGINLQPNISYPVNVALKIPKDIDPGNYMVNSFLFFNQFWGPALYMDRFHFPMKVS
jgi:hypothetical protein